jgi:hypothetical protein
MTGTVNGQDEADKAVMIAHGTEGVLARLCRTGLDCTKAAGVGLRRRHFPPAAYAVDAPAGLRWAPRGSG